MHVLSMPRHDADRNARRSSRSWPRASRSTRRLPGWSAPTAGVRRYADLPREAQRYVARLEEITGVPAAIISTGSAREDTIIREDSVVGEWFGAKSAVCGSRLADQPAARSRLNLDLEHEVVERGGVRVGEVDASTVARWSLGFGSSNLAHAMAPRKRITNSSLGMLIRTFWFGRRIVDDSTCTPTTDRSTTLAGISVHLDFDARPHPVTRGAARAVPVERPGGRLRGCHRDVARRAAAGGARVDRRIDLARFRHLTRVVARVRHHPYFGVRELRVRLDAIDERRAARRGREQPFEHDERRTLLQDRLERLNRLRIREREEFPLTGQALLERGHQIGGGNHDRWHLPQCITHTCAPDRVRLL